jgi:uncharacterized protein DUF3631
VTKQERKDLKRIGDLFRKMIDDGSSAAEREQSREKLAALLKRLGKVWSDLSELLAREQQAEEEEKAERAAAQGATYNPQTGEAVKPTGTPCIDLVYELLRLAVDLKWYELVASTLWILHTWIYDRYKCSPRLAAQSPIPDCGKSTLMGVFERLTQRGVKIDDASAASIYELIDKRSYMTFMLDELDNIDWKHAYALRRVINSGYQRGGRISRVKDGEPKLFSTFAPMALAAIGNPLPWPVLSRSLNIRMQRSRKEVADFEASVFDTIRNQIWLWARSDLKLDPRPAMPKGLRVGRPRDKWRPLIAIADSFGPEWGRKAREAALEFVRNRSDMELSVQLLDDIRELFINIDRSLSKVLVKRLRELADSPWNDLGLTEAKLKKMLEPFGISPGRIWPEGKRTPQTKQGRGYMRVWFEDSWSRYLDDHDEEEEAPTKSAKILHFRGD